MDRKEYSSFGFSPPDTKNKMGLLCTHSSKSRVFHHLHSKVHTWNFQLPPTSIENGNPADWNISSQLFSVGGIVNASTHWKVKAIQHLMEDGLVVLGIFLWLKDRFAFCDPAFKYEIRLMSPKKRGEVLFARSGSIKHLIPVNESIGWRNFISLRQLHELIGHSGDVNEVTNVTLEVHMFIMNFTDFPLSFESPTVTADQFKKDGPKVSTDDDDDDDYDDDPENIDIDKLYEEDDSDSNNENENDKSNDITSMDVSQETDKDADDLLEILEDSTNDDDTNLINPFDGYSEVSIFRANHDHMLTIPVSELLEKVPNCIKECNRNMASYSFLHVNERLEISIIDQDLGNMWEFIIARLGKEQANVPASSTTPFDNMKAIQTFQLVKKLGIEKLAHELFFELVDHMDTTSVVHLIKLAFDFHLHEIDCYRPALKKVQQFFFKYVKLVKNQAIFKSLFSEYGTNFAKVYLTCPDPD